MKTEIPIFFSTDDNYIPFLDVALSSLLENASADYRYRIIILNTGLQAENTAKVMSRQREDVTIEFVDISNALTNIKAHFKNVYHFSVVTYYRLFIASLFPQYEKILYLDCDIVVLGDIAKLYNTELGNNILAAAPEQFVQNTPQFRNYARVALGVDPDGYVNAGVLVMNLKAYRENHIEEQFIKLITAYDFDLLDPDQAYLNYLCRGKIMMLPHGWNKEPMPLACQGEKNIVHYALYKKPWQYEDTPDGQYFWQYAERSPFYPQILAAQAAFTPQKQQEKAAAAGEILEHAERIILSDVTFAKQIGA